MYLSHFGLKEPPFGPTAPAQSLYLGMGHREGLAALEWGLSEPSGLTMLAGEVGAGKTTLVQALVSRGWRDVRVACVSDPGLSYPEMLRHIAEQLGAAPSGLDRFSLLRAIRDLLAALAPEGRAAVVFDEAQALSDEVLDELRLLSNLGAGALAPLKLVLVGQPELIERLKRPRFRALNQRIGARAFLNPLSSEESAAYIEHRMRAAGAEMRRVFTSRALNRVLVSAEGLPRRINILCHNAMMTAYAEGHRRVRASDVDAAVADYDNLRGACDTGDSVEVESNEPTVTGSSRRRGAALIAAAGVSAAAVLGGWYLVANGDFRARFDSTGAQEYRPQERAIAQSQSASPASASSRSASDDSQSESARQAQLALSAPSSPAAADSPRAEASNASVEPAGVVVQAGDTLSSIARNYLGSGDAAGVSRLMHANPQISDSNVIFPGQTVTLIPAPGSGNGESR
ncbi:MAG TPA: AAA family ATPase [Candidatus Binataceae bacterium]|nr:AAA family ATPase [Candidatus Binataceae bacterium]